ncbi:MAG: 50S ribosomal protein L4 [Calditrichia bacterium]
MELYVHKLDGTKTEEKVTLSDKIANAEPNEHAIYLDVKAILANARQGTHKVKNRSEVSGGGRKPFRQKGTGSARQGTIRAPHMPGGGRAFGPKPRDYSQKLPVKVKRVARLSALALKAKNEGLLVVEDFNFESPKTRQAMDILKAFDLTNKKVLFVTKDVDQNFVLSVRNIPGVSALKSPEFSTYDLMNANIVVMQKSAVETVNEVLGK